MPIPNVVVGLILSVVVSLVAAGAEDGGAFTRYKALKHAPAPSFGTWAILDRDGANRLVDRYLSSLGGGEAGTGVMASPPFQVAADTIAFTVCGHDGPQGGQKKNFVALVDAKTGETLCKTTAPGSDPMQARSWDVRALRGREVRIEVHDGDPAGAFAWIGVGRIDAGEAMRVDFRSGLPQGWTARPQPAQTRTETLLGGIPFLRYPAEYTMVPNRGALELPCGFSAKRLFFLGGTVAGGKPLDVVGTIEIVYRGGACDRFPLMVGFTLDVAGKLLSKSKAMHLHESVDPFQHYLVVAPRPEVIEKIVLRRNPEHEAVPRITAITCETQAVSPNLEALPDAALDAEQKAWIRTHTITASSPSMGQVTAEIRRAHKLK